jgi:Leucine-rich repeat (LRR) protein
LSSSFSCLAETPTQFTDQALKSITDLSFRRCLKELAAENNWYAPADFLYISCHNSDIESIEGIEIFINITKLSLYKNKLKAVNLANLSRLEHLNLAGNKLIELHLSGLIALEECYIFKNKLRKVSIQLTPKLNKLKANNNQINELIFRDTVTLTRLYIFDNKLENLEMDNLPALNYLDTRHNPMPDEFYDHLDSLEALTALHDGNSEDWQ